MPTSLAASGAGGAFFSNCPFQNDSECHNRGYILAFRRFGFSAQDFAILPFGLLSPPAKIGGIGKKALPNGAAHAQDKDARDSRRANFFPCRL
jgi:hypothetical protein